MEAVEAVGGDVDGIREVLEYYSERGVLTPRTSAYLKRHLGEFYVCREGGKIAGCCALHRIGDDVAEIRCFAVKDEFAGRGAGRALLNACIAKARACGLKRVFSLSLEKEFFRKNGFVRMGKQRIPLKTFKSHPELSPNKTFRWMMLFAKMLVKDSAHEMRLV